MTAQITDPSCPIARHERKTAPRLQPGPVPADLPHRGINRAHSVCEAYAYAADGWTEIPVAYIGTGSRTVFLRGDLAAEITEHNAGCAGYSEVNVGIRRLGPDDAAALLADGAAVQAAAEVDDRMTELEHHDAIVSRLGRCALVVHDVLPYQQG